MQINEISLTALRKALKSLEKALVQAKNEFTRDAAIQRFEYSFDLCWKTLKRYLLLSTGVEEFQIKNLFREAARQQLIDHVENWVDYLKARNLTVHTYNELIAEETYQAAKKFSEDAKIFFERLEQKIANSSRKK